MGWDYKNEEMVADKAKSLGMPSEVFKAIEKEFLENIVEVDDEEIDTTDIWYKIISVDTNELAADGQMSQPLERLEGLVNNFISNTSDTFLPLGPPQYMDGSIVQTLVDMENLDNK